MTQPFVGIETCLIEFHSQKCLGEGDLIRIVALWEINAGQTKKINCRSAGQFFRYRLIRGASGSD